MPANLTTTATRDQADPPVLRSGLAAAGAVIGGMAALSCCVMPLVFVLVGISGAWIANLTALSPYQPLFVTGALGAIGYGFWQSRRARMACATDGGCARPLPRRLVDGALWTGLALIAIAVGVNTLVPYLLQ